MIISFATIIVLLRKRHLSVLPAGECRHKMTWRIPVPLSFLACRGIVRRFLVRLCKSNNIFLNCQIIRTKNDHKNRPHDSLNCQIIRTKNDHKNRPHDSHRFGSYSLSSFEITGTPCLFVPLLIYMPSGTFFDHANTMILFMPSIQKRTVSVRIGLPLHMMKFEGLIFIVLPMQSLLLSP